MISRVKENVSDKKNNNAKNADVFMLGKKRILMSQRKMHLVRERTDAQLLSAELGYSIEQNFHAEQK